MASNTRLLLTTRQTYQTIRQLTSIAINRKLGISPAQDNPTLGTGRGTLLTERRSTKFAREQRPARLAYHLATIVTLIHVFALLAEEGVAAIADSNLVIGLEFMAPVAVDTNEGVAGIAAYLDFVALVTMKTRVVCCHFD